MKSFLIFLAFAGLGLFLRVIEPRFERWIGRADWARIDRVASWACGGFLALIGLYLVAVVVNSAVTGAIAQAVR